MAKNEPTMEEWKSLFHAAKMFKELAPWEWMEDADVFGIENPEDGEIGYCCILGTLGEVLGLLVYRGSEGLSVYEGLQSGEITVADEDLFAKQKCLAMTFDDRDMLDKKDLAVIKTLGIKFRGRQAWPSFRSHLPGFMPAHLTGAEARFLEFALRAAMGVAERFREDPDILTPPEEGLYLVASVAKEHGSQVWHERWHRPEPYEPSKVAVPIDEVRLARIKANSQKVEAAWEVDFFYAPFVIREGERPFYPYVAIYAVHKDHFVVNFCLAPHGEFEVMFLENLLELLEKTKVLPKSVMVNKAVAFDFFKPITAGLGISLKTVKSLKAVDDAKNALLSSMGV